MSVVGPRPETARNSLKPSPRRMPKYRGTARGCRRDHGSGAGHRSRSGNTSIRRRLALDLLYIRIWTPGLDLWILARTAGQALRRASAGRALERPRPRPRTSGGGGSLLGLRGVARHLPERDQRDRSPDRGSGNRALGQDPGRRRRGARAHDLREPAPRRQHREAVREPRTRLHGPHRGGQPRAPQGRREVRSRGRLPVLDLRDLVDQAVDPPEPHQQREDRADPVVHGRADRPPPRRQPRPWRTASAARPTIEELADEMEVPRKNIRAIQRAIETVVDVDPARADRVGRRRERAADRGPPVAAAGPGPARAQPARDAARAARFDGRARGDDPEAPIRPLGRRADDAEGDRPRGSA